MVPTLTEALNCRPEETKRSWWPCGIFPARPAKATDPSVTLSASLWAPAETFVLSELSIFITTKYRYEEFNDTPFR